MQVFGFRAHQYFCAAKGACCKDQFVGSQLQRFLLALAQGPIGIYNLQLPQAFRAVQGIPGDTPDL